MAKPRRRDNGRGSEITICRWHSMPIAGPETALESISGSAAEGKLILRKIVQPAAS